MTGRVSRSWWGACLGAVLAVSSARADVSGSYDGAATPKKSTETIPVAAVFAQSDKLVTGTLALPADLETLGGAYLLTGKATPKRIKVKGSGPGGAILKYRGKILGTVVQGKLKVKGTGVKLKAALTLTLNPPLGDGAACDAVYTANQAFFDTQVLGGALQTCGTCHAPGLQAGATRLHVDASDPLATARNVAVLVDAAQPAASRIIEKPLNLVPHGGGQQFLPDGAAHQALGSWADLIAAAGCS